MTEIRNLKCDDRIPNSEINSTSADIVMTWFRETMVSELWFHETMVWDRGFAKPWFSGTTFHVTREQDIPRHPGATRQNIRGNIAKPWFHGTMVSKVATKP